MDDILIEWFFRKNLEKTQDFSNQRSKASLFFGSLVYESFPLSSLPRWPFKKAQMRGETMWCTNAPYHCQKNLVSQARSGSKTLYVGPYFCDLSGGRDLGLCPAAYVGLDSQYPKMRFSETLTFKLQEMAI